MQGCRRVLIASAVGVVFFIGCGAHGGAETAETPAEHPHRTREVNLTLDGWEGPDAMGILMAEKRGYFAGVGLEVAILVPATPNRPVQYVIDGTDDIGISHLPQVVLAKEKGAPIIAVASLVSQPTAAMIWLKKSHIQSIADLKGKTIAIPGLPFQRSFLQSVLARGGLTLSDVKVKSVGYKLVPELASGRADASFGGSWNLEGVRLESRGLEPVITRAQDLGIPSYDELVVIARTDRVAEDPQLIRDFTSAAARGTAAAIEDPIGIAEAIDEAAESNPESSQRVTEAEVEATTSLLSGSGPMDPDQARNLVDWMYEEGMIQRKPPVSELLTNDYR
jgi:putative hydroxymethylpyrimidine transport system substrate-binding protein